MNLKDTPVQGKNSAPFGKSQLHFPLLYVDINQAPNAMAWSTSTANLLDYTMIILCVSVVAFNEGRCFFMDGVYFSIALSK